MTRFFSKLDFIHRRLWRDDGLYRAALLLGPAPLLGCMLALGIWKSSLLIQAWTYRPPAWAAPQRSATWNTASDQPQMVQPDRPLPPAGPNGALTGYEIGSQVTINPIEINSQMDVDLKPTPMSAFFRDGPTFDMKQIIGQGPQSGLYAAVGSNFLPIRTAGVYAMTAKFERPAGTSADCLIRLEFGSRRIVSILEVGIVEDISKTFDAARFNLQPGLYHVAWAFTCWSGHELIDTGRMTLMVGHPGESSLAPARADDIVRPERIQR
jgi:hypothetical protein